MKRGDIGWGRRVYPKGKGQVVPEPVDNSSVLQLKIGRIKDASKVFAFVLSDIIS